MWAWPLAREATEIGVLFNISAIAEASDFKIGTRLGFAKIHHKIRHRRKSGRGPGLGELTKILESPLIFVQ